MGLFYKTEKPKFNIIDFLYKYQWEVGFAVGLILILALLLCRCISSANKIPQTLPMDELIFSNNESDADDEDEDYDEDEYEDDEEEEEEEVITPRRSARLRNKRLSLTI